jgi:lipopolysaccharide export LptBFGC system permease protein LptF
MSLDRETRRRIDRAVRWGEPVRDPSAARLAASLARQSRRTFPLMVVLFLMLAGLQAVWIARRGLALYNLIFLALLAGAFAYLVLVSGPRARRAERLNRDLLEGP